MLAIHIYFKKVRHVFGNQLGKTFMYLCLSLALCWASLEFGYRLADEYETAYLLLKLNVAWYFVISLLLHFTLIFTEKKELLRRKKTYFLIYGPALLLFLIDLHTDLLFTVPIKEQWGFMYGMPAHPIIYNISLTWAVITGFYCLYLLLEYYQKTSHLLKKKQTIHVLAGLLLPVATGFNTEYFLPMIGVRVPELFVPTFTIGLIIWWYSIWIYAPAKNKTRYKTVIPEIDNFLKGTKLEEQKLQQDKITT